MKEQYMVILYQPFTRYTTSQSRNPSLSSWQWLASQPWKQCCNLFDLKMFRLYMYVSFFFLLFHGEVQSHQGDRQIPIINQFNTSVLRLNFAHSAIIVNGSLQPNVLRADRDSILAYSFLQEMYPALDVYFELNDIEHLRHTCTLCLLPNKILTHWMSQNY